MCTIVLNVVAPPTSPEESPAMSFAAVSFSSPVCLSVAWDRFISDRALRQEPGWAVPWLGRSRTHRGPPFLGPAQQ